MHALALEFTYLWKLNREHWHKVWLHICIWPQLLTGTSAWTRTHTHMQTSLWTAGSVCSASGSFALLSVSHNDPCTVCVCTAPSSNSARFRPLRHSSTLRGQLLWSRTQTREGLASGHTRKTGAKFIEKSTRISEMHLIEHLALCFLLRQLIMFWHSSQGHRDISHFLNNGSHKDKPAVGKKLVHQVHKASGRLLSSLSLSAQSWRG